MHTCIFVRKVSTDTDWVFQLLAVVFENTSKYSDMAQPYASVSTGGGCGRACPQVVAVDGRVHPIYQRLLRLLTSKASKASNSVVYSS